MQISESCCTCDISFSSTVFFLVHASMSFLSASAISVSISNSDRLYESIFTVEYQQMLIPYDIPLSTMNLSSLSFIDKISRSALADFDLP